MKRRGKEIVRHFVEPTMVTKNTPSLQKDEWLEGFAVGYRDNKYKLDFLLPEKTVKKDTAKYRVYSAKGRFKAAPRRAETALPEQSALQYSEDSYTAEDYALEAWVSDRAKENAANDIDPLSDEVEYLTGKIWLAREALTIAQIVAAIKAAGATYYNLLTAATNWATGTGTINILGNISTGIRTIARNVGSRPNTIVMNTDTSEVVANNATVRAILNYTSEKAITAGLPVETLRGMPITIADALINTGTVDSATHTNILYDLSSTTNLSQMVLLAYIKENDRLTLGRNFVPKQFSAYRGRGLEGDRRGADLVKVSYMMAPTVTNVNSAYMIGNVLGV